MIRPIHSLAFLFICLSVFWSEQVFSQTTITIGENSSSSSTRGPLQRSDTASSTVFSRWVQTFTQTELETAGVTSGVSITELQWELASSNVIIGDGDANVKIYIKNSGSTAAVEDSWENIISGATLAHESDFNTTNNFPGANGWMPFTLSSGFEYTGGAIEIAVDWDCSQVSTPAFSGDGSLKWRWTSTAPDFLVVKKTSSSSPSSTISDLKDERANIQIVFEEGGACQAPSNLEVSNLTSTSGDITWTGDMSSESYNWLIVAAGDGTEGTVVDSGSSTEESASTANLSDLTGYDLYVLALCADSEMSTYTGPLSFSTTGAASDIATIGDGTSSSSTRGPFQRSDTTSSTVFSRFVHIYTASELAEAGLSNSDAITALNWELASSNTMIGDGDASLKVYVKNSAATSAEAGDWNDLIAGSDLLVDDAYNTENNFPGENGWMEFDFNAPFVYEGNAIEVAVDWDCSQVSTPAFSGDGSLKWRWTSTAPDSLVVKKTSSSSASSNISDLKDERANIQFVFSSAPSGCEAPSSFSSSNITMNSVDLAWEAVTDISSYNWIVVAEGAGAEGTPLAEGTTSELTVSVSSLEAGTAYELYVESDCGDSETSGFLNFFSFVTVCADVPFTATTDVTDVACNGGETGLVNLTVTDGTEPYTYEWSNGAMSQNVDGLTAGDYTVNITDANGCVSSASVTITEPTAIELTPSWEDDVEDAGIGSVSVTVEGGTAPYSYAWNGVAGESTLADLMQGTYELEVTDANGCVASESVLVDNITGVEELDIFTNLSIFPNPAINGISVLNLELTTSSDIRIEVYSITGELIETYTYANIRVLNHTLDLSSYEEGLYLVRFFSESKSAAKRLINIK